MAGGRVWWACARGTLCLRTTAGFTFEIYSDLAYGEWILSVWSPDDEQRIPVYDLEGPIPPELA